MKGRHHADARAQRPRRDVPRESAARAAPRREPLPCRRAAPRLGGGGRVLPRSARPGRVPRRSGARAPGREGHDRAGHRPRGPAGRGSGQGVLVAGLRRGRAREEALPDDRPRGRARRRRRDLGGAADRPGPGPREPQAARPRPGERARGDGPRSRGRGGRARGPLRRGARQRAERDRHRAGGDRRPRQARPRARGGVLSDHLERVARAHAAGSGGAGHGAAHGRQGELSTVHAGHLRARRPPWRAQGPPRGRAQGPPRGRAPRRLREGSELKGLGEGELQGLREALLRRTTRAGLTLTDDDRARIQACDDAATLDRWLENVLGAKTAADVLS